MADSKRSRLEMVIAICAVLTSVIALFVAWDQGRVMRAQQHGAVYPVLQVDGFVSTAQEQRNLGIRFSNSGVGPALIASVEVISDGQKIDGLKKYYDQMPSGHDLSWTSMVGRAVAPGENTLALAISWPVEEFSHDELTAASAVWAGLELNVCYCSVFGRCWEVAGLTNSYREQVMKCDRSERDIFEDLSAVASLPKQEIPEAE